MSKYVTLTKHAVRSKPLSLFGGQFTILKSLTYIRTCNMYYITHEAQTSSLSTDHICVNYILTILIKVTYAGLFGFQNTVGR